MAETLLQFQTPISAPDSKQYRARACGTPLDTLWQAWLEFTPVDGGEPVRTGRETTQPKRTDAVYWATGLSAVYLEGALGRALDGPLRLPVESIGPPAFDRPERSIVGIPVEPESRGRAVLNPFSVYQKGEAVLRSQLDALSAWHLVNIVRDYELSDEPASNLSQLPHAALSDLIVTAVR